MSYIQSFRNTYGNELTDKFIRSINDLYYSIPTPLYEEHTIDFAPNYLAAIILDDEEKNHSYFNDHDFLVKGYEDKFEEFAELMTEEIIEKFIKKSKGLSSVSKV